MKKKKEVGLTTLATISKIVPATSVGTSPGSEAPWKPGTPDTGLQGNVLPRPTVYVDSAAAVI